MHVKLDMPIEGNDGGTMIINLLFVVIISSTVFIKNKTKFSKRTKMATLTLQIKRNLLVCFHFLLLKMLHQWVVLIIVLQLYYVLFVHDTSCTKLKFHFKLHLLHSQHIRLPNEHNSMKGYEVITSNYNQIW